MLRRPQTGIDSTLQLLYIFGLDKTNDELGETQHHQNEADNDHVKTDGQAGNVEQQTNQGNQPNYSLTYCIFLIKTYTTIILSSLIFGFIVFEFLCSG